MAIINPDGSVNILEWEAIYGATPPPLNWTVASIPSSTVPHVEAIPASAQQFTISSEKTKKIRKTNFDSTDTVDTIFGVAQPPIVPVESFIPYFKDYVSDTPYILAAPKTYVGIEVEVENIKRCGPNITIGCWQIKNDGSLRNNGREFVTPGVIPLSGAEFALSLLFKELNPDIDFSKRTSIHLHMDVRNLQFKQLLGLLFTYIAVENLLFKFVGNNRRNNIFCVPLIETSLIENISSNPSQFLDIEHRWHKYTALNLLPIAEWGSIEFRHMPGTSNVNMLMQWFDLISCLKIYAYKYPLETIIDEIVKLNSNSRYHQFVESVFGERCLYLDMSNLLNDMEKSVYLVKHCAFANTFHQRVLKHPEIDSQLGKKLLLWMRKLSAEQREALRIIHDKISGPTGEDLEGVYKLIMNSPAKWGRFLPEIVGYIDILIKPSDKKVIKEKIVKSKKAFTLEEFIELDPSDDHAT